MFENNIKVEYYQKDNEKDTEESSKQERQSQKKKILNWGSLKYFKRILIQIRVV